MQFTATDGKGADIILISADKKDFYVHKCNLIFSSKTFSDMLTMPEQDDLATASIGKDGLPVVSLSENASNVKDMLPYFYPYLNPKRFLHNRNNISVERIFKAMQFAEKYEMTHLTKDWLLHAMSRLTAPFLERKSYDATPFYCLFHSGCPSSLQDLKKELFPKMAFHMSLSELDNITADFEAQHRKQFMVYHRQRLAYDLVTKQPGYIKMDEDECSEANCSYRAVCSGLYWLFRKDTIIEPEDLVTQSLGYADLCRQCSANMEKIVSQLRVLLWMP